MARLTIDQAANWRASLECSLGGAGVARCLALGLRRHCCRVRPKPWLRRVCRYNRAVSASDSEVPSLESEQAAAPASPAGAALAPARVRVLWPRLLVVALLVLVVPLTFGLDRLLGLGEVQRGVSLGSLALSGLDRAGARAQIAPLARRVERGQLKLGIGANLLELDAEAVAGGAHAEGRIEAEQGG